jgi:hypothetical protein
MKILVVSDSHLFNDYLQNINNKYKNTVDLMIHCGDSSLEKDNPLLKDYLVVKGNHDDENFPITIIKDHILITHGHKFDVYQTYDKLIQLCKENHCHICLHGHTHVPTHQVHEGIHFINPGSLMINRGSYGYGTYALLTIDKDISVHFYNNETYEQCDEVLIEGKELLEEFKTIIKNKT